MKQFKCKFCHVEFDAKLYFKEHMFSVHGDKTLFMCEKCALSFTRKCRLKRHIESVHEGKKQFQCKNCQKHFSRREHLNRHTQNFHPELLDEGNTSFKCEKCTKTFSRKEHLNRHNKTFHGEVLYVQKGNDLIKVAVKKKLDIPSIRRFKCEICEISLQERGALNRHIATVHGEKRKFKCKFCSHSSKTQGDLNTHVRGVHAEKENYKCRICKRLGKPITKFDSEYEFNLHFLEHKGKTPFKCEVCTSLFSQKEYLQNHQWKKHGIQKNYQNYKARHIESMNRKKKKFNCKICALRYPEKTSLKKHITSIHERKKKFNCDICPSSYHSKWNLDMHVSLFCLGRKEQNITIQPIEEGSKLSDPRLNETLRGSVGSNTIKHLKIDKKVKSREFRPTSSTENNEPKVQINSVSNRTFENLKEQSTSLIQMSHDTLKTNKEKHVDTNSTIHINSNPRKFNQTNSTEHKVHIVKYKGELKILPKFHSLMNFLQRTSSIKIGSV